MIEGLEPCPFCGGNARLSNVFQSDDYEFVAVKCCKCGVVMPGAYSMDAGAAIERWNTRAAVVDIAIAVHDGEAGNG